jgi:hypothetical protein
MLGFTVGDTPLLGGIADDRQQIHHRGLIELTAFFRLRAQLPTREKVRSGASLASSGGSRDYS